MKSKLPFRRQKHPLSLTELKQLIEREIYPIVYINMFPTSDRAYVHTVIVESYIYDQLLLVDPMTGPREIDTDNFLESWEVHGNMAIVLQMENK